MRERHLKFGRGLSRIFSRTINFFNLHNLFEDHTEDFMKIPHCTIGVVIDRGLEQEAKQMAILSDEKEEGFRSLVETITQTSGATIRQYQAGQAEWEEIKRFSDLLLMPYHLWQELRTEDPEIIHKIPTTLLLQVNKK